MERNVLIIAGLCTDYMPLFTRIICSSQNSSFLSRMISDCPESCCISVAARVCLCCSTHCNTLEQTHNTATTLRQHTAATHWTSLQQHCCNTPNITATTHCKTPGVAKRCFASVAVRTWSGCNTLQQLCNTIATHWTSLQQHSETNIVFRKSVLCKRSRAGVVVLQGTCRHTTTYRKAM